MDNRLPPFRPDVVATTSAPRPTPTPPKVPFAQVLASAGRSIVAGAESAMGMIPGGPMVAVATRGGALPMTPMSANGNGPAVNLSPEGPGGRSAAIPSVGGAGLPGVGGASGAGNGGVESSLAQAQEMNLYYLQIQEQVNQQNRVFSTLSNVMKAEHETVKTAIGNIR